MPQEEENGDETEEEEQFALELGASEMYGLQTILNHACVEMEAYQYKVLAEHLSKEVSEVIASKTFTESIDTEMEEIEEDLGSIPTNNQEFGNKRNGFQ